MSVNWGDLRKARYFIKVERVVDCPGNHSLSFVNVTPVSYNGGGVVGYFVVHDDYPLNKIMVTFDVSKCKTLDDVQCEPYVSGVIDWCKVIVDKERFYTPFFYAFRPPIKCPFKKGIHEINNARLSYESMVKFLKIIPPDYYIHYWKTKIVLTPPGRPERVKGCAYIVFKYYPTRSS